MAEWWYWPLIGAIAVFLATLLVWWPNRTAHRDARFIRARKDFHTQRERLEAKFIRLATAHATADALRWENCDFDDDVAYVRSRNTGELSAFVAMTVSAGEFSSTSSGVTSLSGIRTGTAVFRFDRDHWETDGRAILNLRPDEAIRLYQNDLEIVEQEVAGQA
jgi:hypothetical protein